MNGTDLIFGWFKKAGLIPELQQETGDRKVN